MQAESFGEVGVVEGEGGEGRKQDRKTEPQITLAGAWEGKSAQEGRKCRKSPISLTVRIPGKMGEVPSLPFSI